MGLSQLPKVEDGEMEDYMHKSRKVREKITDSFGKPYSQQGKLRKPQNIKTSEALHVHIRVCMCCM